MRKSSWKRIARCLLIPGGAVICGILGLIVGAYISGNYAQDFTFIGGRGYEAAGPLGLIIGAIIGGFCIKLGLQSVNNFEENNTSKYRTGLIWIFTGIYLLIIATLLTLAIDQAYLLVSFYHLSAAPGPVTDFSGLGQLSFSSDLLILATVASILLLLVWRHPRRLLPVSIIAILIFVALNLYSGRHILPQLLIWPAPNVLAKQYVQTLAASDLEAALHLTGGSETCETIMGQVFQAHQNQFQQRLADNQSEIGIKNIALKSITTFYDKPVPQEFVMMQPIPSQLVTVMAEMANGQTIWLNLKMRYTPFWGTRYICGQDIV